MQTPNFLLGLMNISFQSSAGQRPSENRKHSYHLEYEEAPVNVLWIISPISLIKALFDKS